jgi:hypothetical protein
VLDHGGYGIGWYHTDDGHETCRGRSARARPQPLVSVRCKYHPGMPDRDCPGCGVSSQVMIHFHNTDRCIPPACGWPHDSGGP